MAKKIAIGLALLVALLLVVIALQPAEFAIERSAQIAAPPAAVYPHIASLRAMDAWSPWVKMDPKVRITHEGPESGVGAIESWTGPQIGSGRMTITSAKPDEEVEIALDFFEPMPAHNRALFTLASEGGGTRVTWRMEGTNSFSGKAASLVMDMEQMVGDTFERGLAELKKLAEGGSAAPSRPLAYARRTTWPGMSMDS
jgi:uncharacterized protein YndB with AHSA1/START domain